MKKLSAIPSSRLRIRPVRPSDLPDLAVLVLFGNPRRNVEKRVNEHEAGHRHMLVVELAGHVVGTASAGGSRHRLPGSLRLSALDVVEKYRNRGIGNALVQTVEQMAIAGGLLQVNLEVGVGNEGAIRLYKRLGYEMAAGPVEDSWQVLLDDGSTITEGDQVWIMVKKLEKDAGLL